MLRMEIFSTCDPQPIHDSRAFSPRRFQGRQASQTSSSAPYSFAPLASCDTGRSCIRYVTDGSMWNVFAFQCRLRIRYVRSDRHQAARPHIIMSYHLVARRTCRFDVTLIEHMDRSVRSLPSPLPTQLQRIRLPSSRRTHRAGL